jgi:K+-sensing histidine kinase KdpD
LNELKKDDVLYERQRAEILDQNRRKSFQYVGEGATFLVLILVGAVFVYRAVRRQIKVSQLQQNFMMAVTHELKTPIAITQLNLQTLQKRQLEGEQKQKLINNTLAEADRLNDLCNNILVAAQLESGKYEAAKQQINLSELTETVVQEFSNRFPQREFDTDIEQGILLTGEELLLKMMMNNLVENALKYSPKEKPVSIELEKEKNNICFKVKDEGIGISNKEKSKVFDKFYRVGDENVRKTKGTGLGLYLCKRIAKAHHGNIAVKDNQLQGSIFTVTFKL